MTYFPAPSNLTIVKVAEYRRALQSIESHCSDIEYPRCFLTEIIWERARGLIVSFRLMRQLQSLHCTRSNSNDQARYKQIRVRATNLIDQYKYEYFTEPENLSSECTYWQLLDNWKGSKMAVRESYLKQPHLFPAQAIDVLKLLISEEEQRTGKALSDVDFEKKLITLSCLIHVENMKKNAC